jgi:hypothetical protein
MSGVDFYATGFNGNISATQLQSTAFTTAATASIDVTVSNIQNIFAIKSTESTGSNLQFYVNKTIFNSFLTLTNATMISAAQDSSVNDTNTFAQDYLRYVASKIFGSTNGTNLFSNSDTVISSIYSDFSGNYNGLLLKIDMSANITTSQSFNGESFVMKVENNKYYLTSDDQGSYNIVYTLFKQLQESSPSRANTFLGNSNGSIQSFPFVAGDSITIFLTIKSNSIQNVTSNGYTKIDNKTYGIKINIIA